MSSPYQRTFPCVVGLLATIAPVRAADDKAGLAFFESKIRPALVKHCYECHSEDAKKLGGKLRLDTKEETLKGGESGPALVASKPEESLLIFALKWEDNLEMPPEEPLPPAVIADFENWISMGAPDPRSGPTVPVAPPVETKTTHWSFQPVKDPPVPPVKEGSWPRADIDRFLLAEIERAGLKPAGDAPPETLVRRLGFDLTGLAPSYDRVRSFVADYGARGEEAVADLVDEWLASPQFGERWGRFWLDVARFGESNGNDGLSRNPTFPHAWRYRDYVIDAFNGDRPFDVFVREQIAGDLLAAESDAERDRQLVATGFLALGAKPAKAMNENFDMDVVDDQIAVVGSGLLGVSVACARCHDHKHDPIPTRDYYALAGIFKSTETMWGLAAHEGLTAPSTDLHVLKAAPLAPPPAGFVETVVPIQSDTGKPKPIPKSKWPEGTPLAMGVRDRPAPEDARINLKGESTKLGDRVPRGFLSACVMSGEKTVEKKSDSGRLELAEWVTRPDHPLTARVFVNRVWQHLFGEGLVATPDDFGIYGAKPTHPELLDYLATRFVRDHHWSMKALIRELVLTRAYGLDSTADPALVEADSDNRLLARHSRRRLDAEAIRDRLLAATGELDLTPPDGSVIRHRDIMVQLAGNLHEPSHHRSVYLCYLRNSPPPELAPFDLPDALAVTGKRESNASPAQSLFFLNSPFVVDQSRILARKLLAPGRSDETIAGEAIRRIFGRDALDGEIARAISLVRDADAQLSQSQPDANLRREWAWATACQAFLATNEFRYVD
ncbi:MAG: PSD1 domain-containing protein [Verrucomicrobiae bacterium]|nr:PSD1 domain-containing protein [Verrucomicrobiae bacterium]